MAEEYENAGDSSILSGDFEAASAFYRKALDQWRKSREATIADFWDEPHSGSGHRWALASIDSALKRIQEKLDFAERREVSPILKDAKGT
jgi:hypothetical protein